MGDVKLNIGSKIRLLREIKGISQEAVAMDIGISQQAFQQIECGKTKIDLNRADEIARSLQVELEALLSFQPANYLNNCTQSGVINTNNIPTEKLIEGYEERIRTLKSELLFLQNQNTQLLGIIKDLKA